MILVGFVDEDLHMPRSLWPHWWRMFTFSWKAGTRNWLHRCITMLDSGFAKLTKLYRLPMSTDGRSDFVEIRQIPHFRLGLTSYVFQILLAIWLDKLFLTSDTKGGLNSFCISWPRYFLWNFWGSVMACSTSNIIATSWLCTQTCSRLPCPELCFWRFGWSTRCHAHRYDWCPALPGTGPVGELDKWMILPGQLCVLILCDRKLSCNRRSFIFGGHLGAQSTFLLQATLVYLLLGLLSTLWTSSTSKSSHMKARSLLFARLPITWLATHRSVACWLWAVGAGATVAWR